jgi:hypothetical protein
MDVNININSLINLENNNLKVDGVIFQKMLLLYNALEDGWNIKKKNNSYVFIKNHEGKREIFDDSYLTSFMKTNFDINKVIFN